MTAGNPLTSLRSPMAQAGFEQEEFRIDALAIREVIDRSAVRLRALPSLNAHECESLGLPAGTGRCAAGDPATLCLRPGEWLLVSESQESHELLNRVRAEFDASGFYSWDDSDSLGTLRLEGEAATWLLAKHCGLDFFAGCQKGAHCVQARFGQISVLIHYPGSSSGDAFELYFDRGYACYVWELLMVGVPHAVDMHRRYGSRDRGQS